MKISVVLNTLNEESNISNALESVASWVDEIIVVDMYSDDSTVKIAKSYGAKVFMHGRLGFADPARAFAISQASGDWILMLDADEMVPAPLSRHLMTIAIHDLADIVNISWVNYLLGAPLEYTGWGKSQDKHMRFFKRGALHSTDKIHNFLEPAVNTRIMDTVSEDSLSVHHFNYVNSEHFLSKLNRYTSIEAEQAFAENEQVNYSKVTYKIFREFFVRYIIKRGYKDGWRGFFLSLYMGFYQIAKYGKLWELQKIGDGKKIAKIYETQAKNLLLGYHRPEESTERTAE